MKALTVTNQKMWPMLKFLRSNKWTQTDRPKTICPQSIEGGVFAIKIALVSSSNTLLTRAIAKSGEYPLFHPSTAPGREIDPC